MQALAEDEHAMMQTLRVAYSASNSSQYSVSAGLVLATVILFTVPEPRDMGKSLLTGLLQKQEVDAQAEPVKEKRSTRSSRAAAAAAAAQERAEGEASTSEQDSMWGSVRELLSSRAFQVQLKLIGARGRWQRSMQSPPTIPVSNSCCSMSRPCL